MKVAGVFFLIVLMALSVVVYLGYGISVLFTHQTLQQTIVPLLIGALVLSAVMVPLVWGIKMLTRPKPHP